MANTAYATLQGIAPSWADIGASFSIVGGKILDTLDFADLKFDADNDIGEQRGPSGGRVIRRTTGSLKLSGSMTLYRTGDRVFLAALAEKAPKRSGLAQIGLVHFDILAQWTPPGETGIYEVTLQSCRVKKRGGSSSEGADPEKISYDLSIGEIIENLGAAGKVVLL